jgi:hypothetical protein
LLIPCVGHRVEEIDPERSYGGIKPIYLINYNCYCSLIESYQRLHTASDPKCEFLVFAHDDVDILEPDWLEQVEAAFDQHPKVAVIGLGGAMQLGDRKLLDRHTPYSKGLLARFGYMSNSEEWQIHGQKLAKPQYAATIDGFFIAVRRRFLEALGGWGSMTGTNFHNYDNALCIRAWRRGNKVMILPIKHHHYGGSASTKQAYKDWCKRHDTTPEDEHDNAHVWMWNKFRDYLPLLVNPETGEQQTRGQNVQL